MWALAKQCGCIHLRIVSMLGLYFLRKEDEGEGSTFAFQVKQNSLPLSIDINTMQVLCFYVIREFQKAFRNSLKNLPYVDSTLINISRR